MNLLRNTMVPSQQTSMHQRGISLHAFQVVARCLVMAVAVALTVACQQHQGEAQAATEAASATKLTGRTFSSQITGYNHTDDSIDSFNVNGVWGGNVRPHTGGGSAACCLELPLPWHAGLTVTVNWEDHNGQQHERAVTVPAYDEKSLGIFNVHFLRGGEIKVFAINAGLGHPDYPFKGEDANLKAGVPNPQWPREEPASK